MKLKLPDWNSITKEDAQVFFADFCSAIPERLQHLSEVTDVTWVTSRLPLSELEAPMRTFGAWMDSQPAWKYLRRAGKHVRVTIHNPDPVVVAALEQKERDMQAEPTHVLTELGRSLRIDLAMLIGESFRVRLPWTYWSFISAPSDVHFGQPYLAIAGTPLRLLPVLQIAYVTYIRGHENGAGLFKELRDCLHYNLEFFKIPPNEPERQRAKRGRGRGGK